MKETMRCKLSLLAVYLLAVHLLAVYQKDEKVLLGDFEVFHKADYETQTRAQVWEANKNS